jgi:hypothetical protein
MRNVTRPHSGEFSRELGAEWASHGAEKPTHEREKATHGAERPSHRSTLALQKLELFNQVAITA